MVWKHQVLVCLAHARAAWHTQCEDWAQGLSQGCASLVGAEPGRCWRYGGDDTRDLYDGQCASRQAADDTRALVFILAARTCAGEKLCKVRQEEQDSGEEEIYLGAAYGPFGLPWVFLGSRPLQQALPGSKLHPALGPYPLLGYTRFFGIACDGRDKRLPHPQPHAEARRTGAHQPPHVEGRIGQGADLQPLPH